MSTGLCVLPSRSRTDVSPLLACAAALWVADLELELAGAGGIHIH